jgi:hypothetical protein
MSYVTFLRNMHSYHVDVAIQRAKEDACDTCIRISISLADPNLSPDVRLLLEEAQRTHANDARTQRLALKQTIKVANVTLNVCCHCIPRKMLSSLPFNAKPF